MIDDEQIVHVLHQLGDRDAPSHAPVDQLLHRGRQARARRSAGLVTVAAGVVAVGAVGAGALTAPGVFGGGGHPTAVGSGSNAGTSRSAGPPSLALAAEVTLSQPYHLRITVKGREQNGVIALDAAVDPVRKVGYLKPAPGSQLNKFHEERSIGDTCYVQPAAGGQWLSWPWPCLEAPHLGVLTGLTADPVTILDQLRSAATVTYAGRTGTGSAAIDTWNFTYTHTLNLPAPAPDNLGSHPTETITGTVTVSVSTNRVATIDYQDELRNAGRTVVSTSTVTDQFSDYGVPVNVTRPKATRQNDPRPNDTRPAG
jgi:hypothetical protein